MAVDTATIESLVARIAALEASHTSGRTSVKLPTPEPFRGTKDRGHVRDWVTAVDNYFAAAHVNNDGDRITFATVLLRDNALRWWGAARDGKTHTWDTFTKDLIQAFSPLGADHVARSALARLRQRGSVHAYADEFRRTADMA